MTDSKMSTLTAVVLALVVVYVGGWYAGQWTGNFSALLLLLTVISGAYWLAEKFYFYPARNRAAQALLDADRQRRERLAAQGIERVDGDAVTTAEAMRAQPWWLDWTAGMFPVIFAVFFMRSFLYEPFKIPSGSMLPTLHVGDLILVNKFSYGTRLPVLDHKVIAAGDPQRGDVVVFRYPENPSLDYIKRVVAVPGDVIEYRQQRLWVNGHASELTPMKDFYDEGTQRYQPQFKEKLEGMDHSILVEPKGVVMYPLGVKFEHHENCQYSAEAIRCKVPEGHYFMMGDNRDNSLDSRFWGFVPDRLVVGKAVVVWMNFSDLGRIGKIQ